MNLKSASIFFVSLSVLVAILSYFVTNNFIVPIALLGLFLADFFLLFKRIKTYFIKRDRIHECYQFINSFIISLSIKDSYEDALMNATMNPSKDLEAELKALNDLPINEKLIYLRKYFNLSIYKMFLNILEVYANQGGKILTMADDLLKETIRIEESLTLASGFNLRKIIEFVSLWLMTFLILIFLRIGLKEFYGAMLSSLPYFIILCIFFLFVLLSLHIYLHQIFTISIKEDDI